jgi:hypothetical protein
MLATAVNFPTRRAPSPQIRARDTSLDGTTNGSAGINSAPNVDAGIDGATHLGGQRCGDHEDRGDSTNYRKLAEHKIGPQQGRLPPPWRRRTNVWLRVTSPVRGAKRLRSGTANGQRHDAPGSQIDRATSGLTLRKVRSGDYRVNFRDGDETTAYYTNDLEGAVNAAVEMARKRELSAWPKPDPHCRQSSC